MHGHRYAFTRDKLNSCLPECMYPSRETISRTNLQLAALHREIDRCEVKMNRKRMENVMRRPHFPCSDRVDSAELCSLHVQKSVTLQLSKYTKSLRKQAVSIEVLISRDSLWIRCSDHEITAHLDNLQHRCTSLRDRSRMRCCDKPQTNEDGDQHHSMQPWLEMNFHTTKVYEP